MRYYTQSFIQREAVQHLSLDRHLVVLVKVIYENK